MSKLWRISLANLGRNVSEATELASILQEFAPHIKVKLAVGSRMVPFGFYVV